MAGWTDRSQSDPPLRSPQRPRRPPSIGERPNPVRASPNATNPDSRQNPDTTPCAGRARCPYRYPSVTTRKFAAAKEGRGKLCGDEPEISPTDLSSEKSARINFSWFARFRGICSNPADGRGLMSARNEAALPPEQEWVSDDMLIRRPSAPASEEPAPQPVAGQVSGGTAPGDAVWLMMQMPAYRCVVFGNLECRRHQSC